MRYRSNEDYARQSDYLSKYASELREVVVELAAALVRMDKNGYQQATIERACKRSGVSLERIDRFNRERAERIANRKGHA